MEEIVQEMKIRVIPGTDPVTNSESIKNRTLRMAAYCRVSTDSEEQINSYNAQKEYYTKLIADNPNWTMAGLFADAADIIGLNQNPFTEGNDLVLFFLFLQGNEVKF